MVYPSLPAQSVAEIKKKAPDFKPKLGIILGSGLGKFAHEINDAITIPYEALPGFGICHVAGHHGMLFLGTLKGVPVACLQGRFHPYEGHPSETIQIPIRTLKLLGIDTLLITNASASLRPEVTPGNLVIIKDHINFQFGNPLVGKNEESFGPRFPSMQAAYDPNLRQKLITGAAQLGMNVTEGVYIGVLGPSYETPAEIRAFRILGADLVGMSTVPEVIIARHCDLKVAAIGTITNMAAGMSDEILDHESVLAVANSVSQNLSQLIFSFVEQLYE